MIESVYRYVIDIEDVQILIKYAKRIFPQDPVEDCGNAVIRSIRNLQDEIAARKKVTHSTYKKILVTETSN